MLSMQLRIKEMSSKRIRSILDRRTRKRRKSSRIAYKNPAKLKRTISDLRMLIKPLMTF